MNIIEKNFRGRLIPGMHLLLTEAEVSFQKLQTSKSLSIRDIYCERKVGSCIELYLKKPESRPENFNDKDEYEGVYVFYDKEENPMYVGNSTQVLKRIKQQLNHNNSNLLRNFCEYKNLSRNDQSRAKKEIQGWSFKVLLLGGFYNRYFCEFYFAIKLLTPLNDFQ